ncbi:hypothetical protein GUJ75_23925|nr:hypothetical protein [Escherichia coli]
MAQLIQSALMSPGDWGTITVREEGSGKVVIGPVNSLVLPDEEAEMAFMMLLDVHAEGDKAANEGNSW